MSRIPRLVALAAMLALLPAFMSQASAQDIRKGRALAREHCARCHAIGVSGHSRNPNALAFRLIQQRYPVDALEEAFGEGITGSHRGMPDFLFDPSEIGDLLGYMKSLKRR